jgi:hypothetical protein
LNKCISDMTFNTNNIPGVKKEVGMIYNSKYKYKLYNGKDMDIYGYVCNF